MHCRRLSADIAPPGQDQLLCEFCADIQFDPDILTIHTQYNLGTGTRVQSSPCPFCRLIVRAFSEDNQDLTELSDVLVTSGTGPGKHLAFNILNDIWIGFGRPAAHVPLDADRQDEDTHLWENYAIEPTTGPVLDAARILRWISACDQRHGLICRIPTPLAFSDAFRGLPFLRLIDVEASCLVEKGDFVKYAALSYVWGSVVNFRLTKANRVALLAQNSLKEVSHLLPNTIQDAITFTGRLGCRYLWVDALCLLQDDAEALDRGLDAMDLIYERAWVTVVSACGYDANAHLPGVTAGTRMASRNTVEIKPGVVLGIVAGLDGLLEKSVYDSRAWTFQERMLSRRIVYFVGGKVFYRCRGGEHVEHLVDSVPESPLPLMATGRSIGLEAVPMREVLFDFHMMLFDYSKRYLSDQKDALRAMAGIIRRFTEAMKCHFLEGLPTASFDRFILFHGYGISLQRRTDFPSYSWAGWRGAIDVLNFSSIWTAKDVKDGSDWLNKRAWIIWYKRNPSGVTNLVWDPDANESLPYRNMDCVGYRNGRLFSDSRPAFKWLNTKRTAPTIDVSFSRAVPAYPLLQFWTVSVFYTLTDIDVFTATGYLVDRNNTKCGCVWLDGFEEATSFESKDPLYVILLSESDDIPYFVDHDMISVDRNSEQIEIWRYYNVLLLEWQGGIAERRGFGFIYQDAVERSLSPGPLWTEILLA